MTKSWIARFTVCLALAPIVSTTTAQAQTFGVKPGAWENTVTMTGITIPPEALAKMSPEQRDMVQKRLAASGGSGRPTVRKSCVKKEDLDQDRFVRSRDASCTVKTVSRTATKLVLATTCPASTPPTSGTMTFEAKTPESVVGSIDQQRGGGKPLHIDLVGRWLGPSCDGIDADAN